jgi:alkanesulfonate monooxygenase SsuD/methylene tetrahydromethanopterin reductase-like flavin-dependent oxidoreductase (luciferase family)
MRVGYGATFQNPGRELTDREVYREEIRLARLAEPLGFDSVWSTEHHVTGYQMCPDVLQFLSYMAGTSDTLELGSMVVVIPWHRNPARVAEQIAVLDHYCGGRLTVGFGRGSGRIEFELLGVDMGEARERFMEATELISRGLETGYCEYDGAIFQQPRLPLRPAPFQSFKGRLYAGVASHGSIRLMAKPGLGILLIPQRPWEDIRAELAEYRELFRERHGEEAPPTVAVAWIFCDEDEQRAQDEAERWMSRYWRGVIKHYDFANPDNFKGVKGYENYVSQAQGVRDAGEDAIAKEFMKVQVWGTPAMCRDKIRNIHEQVGCEQFVGIFRYADMPFAVAERNLRTFAATVVPDLKKLPAKSA